MENKKLKFSYTPYILKFKEPGGTSRGILKEKLTYFLKVEERDNPNRYGFGEIPVFPGLSKESIYDLERVLNKLIQIEDLSELPEIWDLSSLIFGLEQSIGNLRSRNGTLFPSPFTEGKRDITINGLVWMGDFNKMRERVIEKLKSGYHCIKIKIAAINWEEELELIKFIRDAAGNDVIIRVDANGGFTPEECLTKLEQLSRYNIHSVEQPIKPGNFDEMRLICNLSPIPVALDEELIGIKPGEKRSEILSYLKPRYVILKPAFCYGFSGILDWIERARQLEIGYWITSALESSVGLSAIAEFTGTLNPQIPQGLGTGNLFTNNFPSKLKLMGDKLIYDSEKQNYNKDLQNLEWKDE